MSNDQNQPGKPKRKHALAFGNSTSVGILNLEVGKATVERLEHIAETLDRIAVLLENHAQNDGHQQSTGPGLRFAAGPQDNDNS